MVVRQTGDVPLSVVARCMRLISSACYQVLPAGFADLVDDLEGSTSSSDDDEEEKDDEDDSDRESSSSDSMSDISIDDLITDLGGGLSLMEQYPVLYNEVPVSSNTRGAWLCSMRHASCFNPAIAQHKNLLQGKL